VGIRTHHMTGNRADVSGSRLGFRILGLRNGFGYRLTGYRFGFASSITSTAAAQTHRVDLGLTVSPRPRESTETTGEPRAQGTVVDSLYHTVRVVNEAQVGFLIETGESVTPWITPKDLVVPALYLWRLTFFTVGSSTTKLWYTVDYEVVALDEIEYATLLDEWSLAKRVNQLSALNGLEGGR